MLSCLTHPPALNVVRFVRSWKVRISNLNQIGLYFNRYWHSTLTRTVSSSESIHRHGVVVARLISAVMQRQRVTRCFEEL
jgi:hypothetical protein